MSQDYNSTLNLPKTEFQMRASLPQKEPAFLEKWNEENLYENLIKHNEGKPKFILHDGPPYANGDIHMGHSLNKILKDIIVRYKNMAGFQAPHIPGWDTHGLPIERQAIKKIGIDKANISPLEFRKQCKDFALSYVENQKAQMRRLGIMSDFDHPYLTLHKEFEAKQIDIFGDMAKKGYIYKGLKPVYWCPHDETALAEAEIEYAEDECDSIYVKFRLKDDKGLFDGLNIDKSKIFFVIWTTTTWTLPGNVAIAVNPDFEYALVKFGNEYYVMAKDLINNVRKAADLPEYEVLKTFSGYELEYVTTQHPFLDRDSVVITGNHVTLETGTGCVHTAPGFGADDFIVCQKYKDIPIVVPVNGKGILTDDAGKYAGLYYEKSNKAILEDLKANGDLLAVEHIVHQYPHCWRCKHPIIFRATEQWFCSIDGFKDKALEEIKKVNWIPGWGEDRISNMVKDRNDWCISRQRTWGVPIPIFYCKKCHKEIITEETINAVSELFKREGSDAWYKYSADEILPKGIKCACGCDEFEKETDIMDVWFDSGSSHTAVLETREGQRFPADLYLEGNDQYRGWFQSSLLTSVASRGVAPYKNVLIHGFIIDMDGRKMSKSAGNGKSPSEICDKFGADILRLWVASSDFKSDIRVSDDIFKQLSESYRKIRNTARYILGNINDFDPNENMVAFENMTEIDKWALIKLNKLVKKVTESYDEYEFHTVYHAVHNFCVVDMSNFYLDVIKDRLYCEKTNSLLRRSAQSAMYLILDSLVKILTPILAFTSQEIFEMMPKLKSHDERHILFNDFPKYNENLCDDELETKWQRIITIRDDIKKALEDARKNKIIGSSLDAKVTIYCDNEEYDFIKSIGEKEFAVILISSKVEIVKTSDTNKGIKGENTDIYIEVDKAEGEKCERCWIYDESVGQNQKHPTLCHRCAQVIE